jgi:hypothetical protein
VGLLNDHSFSRCHVAVSGAIARRSTTLAQAVAGATLALLEAVGVSGLGPGLLHNLMARLHEEQVQLGIAGIGIT